MNETTGHYKPSECFLFDALKKNQSLDRLSMIKQRVLNDYGLTERDQKIINRMKAIAFDVDLFLQSINQR